MSDAQLYSTDDVESFTKHLMRPRHRVRTMSMLTVSSSATTGSRFEITKTLSASAAICSRPENKEVYASFIPVRSAANCLRDFAIGHTTTISRPSPKRRRVTFVETGSPLSSDDDDDKASLFINRPFPSTPKKVYQCPAMSSSSSIRAIHDRIPSSGIHPILAKLEKESKLCTKLVYCSTCGKPGQDYPRCGKCGVMWCSRTCRLVAGKRHVCPPMLL